MAKYPFKKSIVASLHDARQEWWQDEGGVHLACPDIALLSPLKIVFEGKLFRENSQAAAKKALVEGVFESAFYRGLPTLLSGRDEKADCYDYACLLAYDASEKRELSNAWANVSNEVRDSCWEAMSTRVMVLQRKG